VEPFGGGLSISLRLLSTGVVSNIAVGERDPLIAAFWKTVFYDTEWIVDQIERVEVTLQNWKRFRENSYRTNRERALACVFLNRTSFSGILAEGAGPIGGQKQQSAYKIDCRFNKQELVSRIRSASALRDRVAFVNHGDWRVTVRKAKQWKYKGNELFFYLDPPFYEKAERLYRFHFENQDHIQLSKFLSRLKSPWLLSYDRADQIIELYSSNGNGTKHVDHLYSIASAGTRQQAQELFITNLPRLSANQNGKPH
jgi:DNA adenine methylase